MLGLPAVVFNKPIYEFRPGVAINHTFSYHSGPFWINTRAGPSFLIPDAISNLVSVVLYNLPLDGEAEGIPVEQRRVLDDVFGADPLHIAAGSAVEFSPGKPDGRMGE